MISVVKYFRQNYFQGKMIFSKNIFRQHPVPITGFWQAIFWLYWPESGQHRPESGLIRPNSSCTFQHLARSGWTSDLLLEFGQFGQILAKS
jgi:hypothetical protein